MILNDDGYLEFNGVDVKALIDKYGTPLKLSYLPKIGMQINKAKKMFETAIKKHKYEGSYNYCYCTKSSHFSFMVEEALKIQYSSWKHLMLTILKSSINYIKEKK